MNRVEKLKNNFPICRTKLENNEIIKSVQNCFHNAFSQQLHTSFDKEIRNLLSNTKIKTMIFSLLLGCFIIVSSVINMAFKISLLISIFISTTLCSLIIVSLFYVIYNSIFRYFITETLMNKDLSTSLGNSIYSKDNNCLFIAKSPDSDKNVIAMAAIMIEDDKNKYKTSIQPELCKDLREALLIRVCVHREYQGLGLGRSVVLECIDFAKKKNVKVIKLMTSNYQESAVLLYKSLGFKITSTKKIIHFFNFIALEMQLNM